MSVLTWEQVKQIWIQAGGNPKYADMAAAIAYAESSFNTNSKMVNAGGSIDYGLWQINSHYNGGSTADFDPITNARHAIRDSKNGSTWRPWCSAYSDNACGTKGGTYLGPGSHALSALKSHSTSDSGSGMPTDTPTIQQTGIVSDTATAIAGAFLKPLLNWLWYMAETSLGITFLGLGILLLVGQTKAGKVAVKAAKVYATKGAA